MLSYFCHTGGWWCLLLLANANSQPLSELLSYHSFLLLVSVKVENPYKSTYNFCYFFSIYFAFIFRAGVRATSEYLECCLKKIWEAGNHRIASWDAVADEVSSGCALRIFSWRNHQTIVCCSMFILFMCCMLLSIQIRIQAGSSTEFQSQPVSWLLIMHTWF